MPKTKDQKRREADSRQNERNQLLSRLGLTGSKHQYNYTLERLRKMVAAEEHK